MIKVLKHLFVVFLPNPIKIFIYNKYFDWDVHKTARIGFSFICADKVKIGAHTRIGHFNMIKNLEIFEIGEHSFIGNFNCANALPVGSKIHFQGEKDRVQALIIGDHSSVVKKHYFDCNNKIEIGRHTTIAGHGCSFFTHSINVEENRQETKKITIGHYCMVGACSVVTRGAILPDCSILAANSTLHKPYDKTHSLYSGVPAKAVKDLSPDSKFFHRENGFVD